MSALYTQFRGKDKLVLVDNCFMLRFLLVPNPLPGAA